MRIGSDPEYGTHVVSIDPGDSVEDVISKCKQYGAVFETADNCYLLVQFPGESADHFTEEDLRSKFPVSEAVPRQIDTG